MNAVLKPVTQRPMTTADLDVVMAVEAMCYSHPWTRGNFIDSLAAGYLAELRLSPTGDCIGYYVAMPGLDEMHLLNLTTAPRHQRQGHALAMLEDLHARSLARGDAQLWLEVRAGNTPARLLYRRFGFVDAGLRRAYYPLAGGRREDAIVMSLDLHAGTPAGSPHAVD